MVIQKEVVYALYEHETESLLNEEQIEKEIEPKSQPYKVQIAWKSVLRIVLLHVLALYGLTQLGRVMLSTILFTIVLIFLTGMGVQAGKTFLIIF